MPDAKVPSAADALFELFVGLTTYEQHAPPAGTYGVYASNFYKRIQDEVLNLIALQLSGGAALLVRNESGSTINKGRVVAISGYSSAESRFLIVLADPADITKPYAFVMDADLANNTNGKAYPFRDVTGLDTSGAGAVGDPVFPASGTPNWGYAALSGANQLSQEIGRVTSKHASTGSVRFFPGARLLRKIGTDWLQDAAVTGAKLDADALLHTRVFD